MFRRVAPVIVLLTGLAPAVAQAQTNIDQDKTPAQIFANDCATCHKSARGLANGRGSSGLASFLSEHYTASKDEASALAAYVMGAGGGEVAPATARGPKPAPDHGRATVEDAKPPAHGARTPGKPEETPASAKLKPNEEEANRPAGSIPTATQEQGERKPALGRQPGVATRGRRRDQEPTSPPPEPAAAAEPAAPSPSAQSAPETSPPAAAAAAPAQSAAAPSSTDTGENAPVPRDNIPD